MNRIAALLSTSVLCALLAACSQVPKKSTTDESAVVDKPVAFSADVPGGLPKGWEPVVILRTKTPTDYRLVTEQRRTVLHAKAVSASSGLMQRVNIDPNAQPWLSWQWKVANLIKTADNFQGAKEDSPVRIVLGFDGDKDSLPFADQMLFDTAKLLTGREVPYATLMYIWENKAPVGTIIPNGRTKRIQKVVAASGSNKVGQWCNITRNIVEDFEKAFGEKPGRLISIGVLTDTDNTGETVEAWYGDIRLLRVPEPGQQEIAIVK
jgi:hypothetical protein